MTRARILLLFMVFLIPYGLSLYGVNAFGSDPGDNQTQPAIIIKVVGDTDSKEAQRL